MQNYGSVVANVLATQFVRPQVPAADEETAKAQLTRAAAFEINQIDPNVGLLQKTSGNQVHGMSVDGLVDRSNGDFADIATAEGVGGLVVTIKAHWIQRNGTAPMTSGWIQPTAALALLPGPMERTGEAPGPGPDPGPGPQPPSDNSEVLAKLDQLIDMVDRLMKQQAGDTARILERDDYNTEKIQRQLAQIVEDAEKTLKQVMIILLATRQPQPEKDATKLIDTMLKRLKGA
jgi:hypothetical protein